MTDGKFTHVLASKRSTGQNRNVIYNKIILIIESIITIEAKRGQREREFKVKQKADQKSGSKVEQKLGLKPKQGWRLAIRLENRMQRMLCENRKHTQKQMINEKRINQRDGDWGADGQNIA